MRAPRNHPKAVHVSTSRFPIVVAASMPRGKARTTGGMWRPIASAISSSTLTDRGPLAFVAGRSMSRMTGSVREGARPTHASESCLTVSRRWSRKSRTRLPIATRTGVATPPNVATTWRRAKSLGRSTAHPYCAIPVSRLTNLADGQDSRQLVITVRERDMDRSRLADPEAVADYLGLQPRRLEIWRSEGAGPPYVKVGRLVRYRWDDVLTWVEQHTVVPQGATR